MLLGKNVGQDGAILLSRIVDASPPAKAHIATLSKIGYDFNTAVSDIIDNSITANAQNIYIEFELINHSASLFIIDDGDGMIESDLIANMSIGCKDPSDDRTAGDLGRFGAGLKTASFSQAEILSVISSTKDTAIAAAVWDKNIVKKTNRWDLKVLDPAEIVPLMPENYRSIEKGTIVRWDNITSIRHLSHSHDAQQQIDTLCAGLHSHVGLFFHRFLPKEGAVRIKINNRAVEAIDPFMRRLPGSEELQSTSFRTGADKNKDKVHISAYRLPFFTNMKPKDLDFYGGQSHITQTQGLYIYREKRLIVAGGWMGMNKRSSNLTGLCRIQVDVPSSLDDEWSTDVKKSSLQIPFKVKEKIKQLMATPCESSKRSHTHRATKEKANNYWLINVNKDSGITSYEIDPVNSEIRALMENLHTSSKQKMVRYLSQLAAAFPVMHVFNTLSESYKNISSAPSSEEEIAVLLARLNEPYDDDLHVDEEKT